ncbi:hypothetical protein [Thioclava sp. JE_KL1]|uniref:hypothetical protein n=1 Tax=Thioclava sp. JE_KL1 TaxID=2651187 RepID=UPI0009F64819|nr:hypothetical protein [Thioclava sp. JE_KL1]MPQ96062.1 hypothetical protein [Thioclava sp. JE_KL1]
MGVLFQMHRICQARDDALRLDRSFRATFRRLLDRDLERPTTAADIMSIAGPRAPGGTKIRALLPMMAEVEDAVPVLEYGKIVGIVTRTNHLAALSRGAARAWSGRPGCR